MSDPTFAQPERRSFLLPTTIALAALVIAILLAVHFFPATSVDGELVHSETLPVHTVFKSDSIVHGVAQTSDTLFIASTVRVENKLRVPIFVEDLHLTLTNPDNAELTIAAPSKSELASLEQTFPRLAPLASAPLYRDTSIEPGQSATGVVVFPLNLTPADWNARKSAVVKIDLYHQTPVFVTIPK